MIIWSVLGGLAFICNIRAIKIVVVSLKQHLHHNNLEMGDIVHPIVILMGFLFYSSANFLALLYGLKLASAPPMFFKYVMVPALLPALLFLYYFGKTSFSKPVLGHIQLNQLLYWPLWACSVYIFAILWLPEIVNDVSADSMLHTGLWVVMILLAPWLLIKWVIWRKLSSKIKP